jgi:hypothetical protein
LTPASARRPAQCGLAEFAEGVDQAGRVIDQHAFDQLAERTFHRVFPTGIDVQAFADTRRRTRAPSARPRPRPAPAQRGLLQGFQRGQATAQAVGLLAQFGQFVLAIALLFLHGRHALLAQLDVFAQFIQRGLLRVVLQVQLLEGFFSASTSSPARSAASSRRRSASRTCLSR